MAILITTDGQVVRVTPRNGRDYKCEELQKFVDGYFETVPLEKTDKIMVVNEEGKLLGMEYNHLATEMFNNQKAAYLGYDAIVGNALVCDRHEIL